MNEITQPRVALIQSHWKGSPEESLEGLLTLLNGITEPVDLICLPEFFLGAPWYFPGRQHLIGIIDQTIPGPVTDLLSDIARQRSCYIVCGTLVERELDRYYNTSVVIDQHGRIAGKARKIHRYGAEVVSVTAGTDQLLLDTPFGKLGVCICSDFWISEMPRMLALRGAEIIVVPGASIVHNLGITRPCIQANSTFNVCYTLYAGIVGSVTGERGGRQVTVALGGYSTVADPERIVATIDDDETVVYATLDMEWLRQMREVDLSFARSLYWCLHGRQPDYYGGIMQPYIGASNLTTLLERHMGSR